MSAEKYHFGINNRPHRFQASVAQGDGRYEASTTTLGRSFEGEGETSEEALAALRAAMEKAGWFLHQPFTRAGS